MIVMCTQYYFFKLYDFVSQSFFQFSIWKYRNTFKSIMIAGLTICCIMLFSDLLIDCLKDNKKALKAITFLGIR